MSYEVVLPVIVEVADEERVPPTILHSYMYTDIGALKRSWMQLREERDTFEAQFYASEKKVLELTRQLHEEQNLNAYIVPKRMCSTFLS